ncbi:MAG: acyl-CoA dehydrogenase family protein [Rhodococcus fascians]
MTASATGDVRQSDDVRAEIASLIEQNVSGALEREIGHQLPTDVLTALKQAGFGALRVPQEFGGRGLSWVDITRVWIDLAAADANLAQALRGHFTLVEDVLFRHRRGADQSAWFERFVAGEIAGNAWTEIGSTLIGDVQTVVVPEGDHYRINGRKFYTTGTIFAEWADVYARLDDGGESTHVIAIVDTRQPGVVVQDDWDGFGQRGTGSGTAEFTDARVERGHLLPFVERHPYQTALYQLNLIATLAGIAKAIHRDVVAEVRARTRNYSHANASRVRDDPQVLGLVGEISAAAYAAEAVAVRAAAALDVASDAATAPDAELRRATEAAELETSAAQVAVSKMVLDSATELFDALGASATSTGRGLDRHWRNARTVASHNPRLFKAKVLGAFDVNATPPPYAWSIGTTPSRDGA